MSDSPTVTSSPSPAPARDSFAAPLLRAVLWGAVALWAGVIFRFSALPGSQIPGRFAEVGHFGEYAVLGGVLYLALRVDLDRGKALAIATIAASIYGVSDEFHQHFVMMRTPDISDWGLDTLGATFGATAALALAARLRLPWARTDRTTNQ